MHLYFDSLWNERRYQQHLVYPLPDTELENQSIVVSVVASERPFYAMMVNTIPNLNFGGFGGAGQCFPYYRYSVDGTNRRENITDWALKTFREHYQDKKITKWNIFYYVYGILHHPVYREKYGENLKRELPRVPFAPDFRAFAKAGEKLAKWHLEYETVEPYPLEFVETQGMPLSYRVDDKMRLNKEKTEVKVNRSLTLRGIPAECFEYRLGNRSALEWVIDQYRMKKDARSGIESDPNRAEDPEYIVRLVGQVIQVSLETVRIVKGLPDAFEPEGEGGGQD